MFIKQKLFAGFLVLTLFLLAALTRPAQAFSFSQNLQTGTFSQDVKELQKFLNANGYVLAKFGAGSAGQETTFFGSLTEAALIKFQAMNKVAPAVGFFGSITREVANRIISGLTAGVLNDQNSDQIDQQFFVFRHNLSRGSISQDVEELQKFLNANGYILAQFGVGSSGEETTFFGPLTQASLIKFQAINKIIPAIGFFGPITREVVNNIVSRLRAGAVPDQNNNQPDQPDKIIQSNYYSIGGNVTGLAGVIVLQNNGRDDITINPGDNSSFSFPTKIADGASYLVTIKSNLANQKCFFNNSIQGVVSGSDVDSIKIACGENLNFNPFISGHIGGGGGTYTYSLAYAAGANGSLTGVTSQTVNSGSNGSAVTAVPDANYYFVNWSDSSTANPRTDINVTANLSVTAQFAHNAGVAVSAISNNTSEAGATATFTVVLQKAPSADVTIPVASSDTTEGTVSASSLVFTSANWDSAQTVTVTGANDFVHDGDIAYTIILDAATSADADYSGLGSASVSVTNTDNDAVGVTVGAISGPTSEAGATATFTVVLDSQPTANVTIPISSSDSTEGTVSTSSLVFTADNWNAAQTVTVTGADDYVQDGNIIYTIALAAATSADADYSGLNASDVSVTNTDNDIAGVTVGSASGPTSEAGATATFTVVLDSQPTANVTVPVSSSDTTEGTVSTSSLVFTADNWNAAQTVTVTGVDDYVQDGNVAYAATLAAATSADTNYGSLNASDVSLSNADNDVAGFTVNVINNLTTESGGTGSFSIVLTSEPTNDVTIPLSSSDTAMGTLAVSQVVFTNGNWDTPQTITVTGVDDSPPVSGPPAAYTIVTGDPSSADAVYNAFVADDVADVAMLNQNNDPPGVTVTVVGSGQTTEAGGTVVIRFELLSEPTSSVAIPIASSDTTEGTVSTSSLTISVVNWNNPAANTVTMTGVDDSIMDGDIAYTLVTGDPTSADPVYNALTAADVADPTLVNVDNDTSGIAVSAISGTTLETGTTATFTVVLISQPTADVTIPISSGDATEGTVSTSSLVFTTVTWDIPQTVTVTGVDDAFVDGNITYSVLSGTAISNDAVYNGVNPNDVVVTNLDNDHSVVYTAGANGVITGSANQVVADGADATAVTASANAGYHFVNWSDASTANPRTDANVTGDISVTANFAIDSYTLTYTAGANGSITGTSPQTVSYGNSGSAVTAVPNAYYEFVNWSDASTANPRTDANVAGDISVTANFALDTHTKLLLHMNDVGLTDSSTSTHSMILNGAVARSSTQSKFGGYSAYFNATGDYLSTTDSADWYWGTGDFTIDGWFYLSTSASSICFFNQWQNIWNGIAFYYQGSNNRLYYRDYNYIEGISDVVSPNPNAWNHFAYVRTGTSMKFYLNGVGAGTAIVRATLPDWVATVKIGVCTGLATSNGYLDELRVSKGVARWSSNFTPQGAEY